VALAEKWRLELEGPEWFITDHAVEQLQRARAGTSQSTGETVGAVARDMNGHVAAATSTGGRVGQLPGRVGDSPVVGAGVWADDRTCAVSATGRGETFLLTAFAHEIDALMRLSGLSVGVACERALDAVSLRGARGGCIAVDPAGTVVTPFTTAAMYRGWTDMSGDLQIQIQIEMRRQS
jgi:beta-aspartyl-peptidase (threonine type)